MVPYRLLFKIFFAPLDAETAHHLGLWTLRLLGFSRLASLARIGTKDQKVLAMGLEFDSPFGIAAGFDKNALAVSALGQLGFSHVEIGTVTRFPQAGNPKPRLFRLLLDQALVNRMGFNNHGADRIAKRLARLRRSNKKLPIIGVNIGKSKITPVEDALADYVYSAERLAPYADYLAVNVSSPNTPGLRALQAVEQLEPVLKGVKQVSQGKPVLVKIAPDLADEDVLAIAQLVARLNLAGVIATNTTVSRSGLMTPAEQVSAIGEGGLSGSALKERSLQVLRLLRTELQDGFCIISVGGVWTADDVLERVRLGAQLVQGYTGFIYEGPGWARKIRLGLELG